MTDHLRPLRLLFLATIVFVTVLASLSMYGARGSGQPVEPIPQEPLRVTTEIVKLDATVTDERGEFVSNLRQENFRILDGDADQPVVFFTPTDAAAQILVMVETSPAVYLIQNDHVAAVYALATGLADNDEIGLVVYNAAPKTILDFTADRSSLTFALQQIQYTLGFGELNLFDSLSTTLESMQAAPGKKALVLLTTGLDSAPASHREALMEKLRSTDVVIFPVTLGTALRSSSKKSKHKGVFEPGETSIFIKADETLRSLANVTGGRAFFPKSASDFAPAYRQIAATLRHQYVLGIVPAHDGQYHPLTVQILDDNGVPYPSSGKGMCRTVFVRHGYLAPTP